MIETNNIVKGMQDDIAEAIEMSMPRQAIVTRVDGPGVWVRFTPVDNTVPEMWFPSNVAGLAVGTAGWVHPLAGGKRRFIADDVMRPVTKSGMHTSQTNADTAGDYAITGGDALLTYSGLVPGKMYRIAWSCDFGVWRNTTTTSGRFGVRIVGGETTWNRYPTIRDIPAGNTYLGQSYSLDVTASNSGTISICPGFAWGAGQIRVSWATITATLSER